MVFQNDPGLVFLAPSSRFDIESIVDKKDFKESPWFFQIQNIQPEERDFSCHDDQRP